MIFVETIENAALRETPPPALLTAAAHPKVHQILPIRHDAKTHFHHFTRTLCSEHAPSSPISRCGSLQDRPTPLLCAVVTRPKKPGTP